MGAYTNYQNNNPIATSWPQKIITVSADYSLLGDDQLVNVISSDNAVPVNIYFPNHELHHKQLVCIKRTDSDLGIISIKCEDGIIEELSGLLSAPGIGVVNLSELGTINSCQTFVADEIGWVRVLF